MKPLAPADLLGLEQYARERGAIRARMIGHRAGRRLLLGAHCSWSFEDRATIGYQVQEMLRAERIFEPEGIAAELAAYNPLIPDGSFCKNRFQRQPSIASQNHLPNFSGWGWIGRA